MPDSLGNVTCSDYNRNAALNVDLRIANRHDSTVNRALYTLQDHTNRKYIRNQQHWTSGIDLTCISPYNGKFGKQRAGTLITKRHVILAAHFPIAVGDSIRFVSMDNEVITRNVVSVYSNTIPSVYYPDIYVLTLDCDVPSTISPCRFLPANYANYIANDGYGLPVLKTDQEEKGLVTDLLDLQLISSTHYLFYLNYPTDSNRLELYEDIIGGDSGNPCFLILSGQLVLIGTFTYGGPGSGASLTYFASKDEDNVIQDLSINECIAKADAKIGINTGYKVSYFKFEDPSEVKRINDTRFTVLTQQKNLNILQENSSKFNISVVDVLGKEVMNTTVYTSNYSVSLPFKGIFIVTLCQNSEKSTYKIIVH